MSTQTHGAAYTFGDSALAARRLELLSQAFAGSSREFLRRSVTGRSGLAVDLGCGPGHSTLFLAESIDCDRVVGLDNSEHFISLAEQRATEKITFCRHDFTSIPFPTGPCDLLYARFELSHVREPQALVSGWATQLRPGGRLLMEETEWIRTSNPAFITYLRIVESMLEHQGARLYVGADLDRIADSDRLERRDSDLVHPAVSDQAAANLFFLNIQSWKHQPFIRENYSPATIRHLESDLEALTHESPHESGITWGLRQLAFERV